jgi:hypothetical protein
MALTYLQIKNAKPGMHIDGNNLYLSVTSKGAKSWIFRFQVNDKRREMGLGSLTALPATEARAKASQLKVVVAHGIDPLAERDAERLAMKAAEQADKAELNRLHFTFRVAAEHHIANYEPSWRNEKHAKQWTSTLLTYAYPKIGDMPVEQITMPHIVEILQPIWSEKPETASRVRMRINDRRTHPRC